MRINPVLPGEMMKSDTAEITASRLGHPPYPCWAFLVASALGIGRLRPAPGTWGSLAAVLIWRGLYPITPPTFHLSTLVSLIAIAVILGIPAATLVSRATGVTDPQWVVIDELAGQWTTLLFAPVSWKTLLTGFILFRGFDILKPPPVRQLERLRTGFGIVADDLGAGVYALVGMQLLLHFKLLSP
jgi:phosphatidylglycerophosphatase A